MTISVDKYSTGVLKPGDIESLEVEVMHLNVKANNGYCTVFAMYGAEVIEQEKLAQALADILKVDVQLASYKGVAAPWKMVNTYSTWDVIKMWWQEKTNNKK